MFIDSDTPVRFLIWIPSARNAVVREGGVMAAGGRLAKREGREAMRGQMISSNRI
jgi:hypothetical protein